MTEDTATVLIGLTVGAVITVAAAGAIGLFYVGRMMAWWWRQ